MEKPVNFLSFISIQIIYVFFCNCKMQFWHSYYPLFIMFPCMLPAKLIKTILMVFGFKLIGRQPYCLGNKNEVIITIERKVTQTTFNINIFKINYIKLSNQYCHH